MRVDPSFEAFVAAHSAGLLRTAYLLTLDRGEAEDLLQTALLRAARRWRRVGDAPLAYVRRILVNLAHDRRRLLRRRPRQDLVPAHADPVSAADPVGDRVGERLRVAQALALLPERQRHVIVLRFFDDLPVAETAELLGCSEGTVKSYTARALARLRNLLGEEVHHAHR
jgi:RNA polymerase sigma-70 factor (sigma-E family)